MSKTKLIIVESILFLVVAVLFFGCASDPAAEGHKVKITQGEKVWYSCDVWAFKDNVEFKDLETGRTVILYGNILIEQTDIPCPAN